MPTSITVVQADGTIWTANSFTQVIPPPPGQIATITEVDVKESDGTEQTFIPPNPNQ